MARDPLQAVDQTVPGFLNDPSTYSQPTPGGKRRARTFSQAIADATRGVDAGMNRYTKPGSDLSSDPYLPDWRGHLEQPDPNPAPRDSLQLATYHNPADIHPLTLQERMGMAKGYDPDEPRDERGEWTGAGNFTAYHGTLAKYTDSIAKHGIRIKGAHRNYGKEYYQGHRGESVYVAKDLATAKVWAKEVSENDGGGKSDRPVVMRVEIPHDQRSKIMTDELGTAQFDPTVHNLRFEGKIKPDWIKGVREWNGKTWSPEHALTKADASATTIYLCVTVDGFGKYDPDEARDEHGEWTTGAVPSGGASEDEAGALNSYKNEKYDAINRLLSGRSRPSDDLAETKEAIAHIDAAMARSTITDPILLYRGMNDAAGRFADDRFVGKDITYPTFVSASKSETTANLFREDTGVDHTGSFIMEINAPKGTHAIDMDRTVPYDGQYSEREVLLDRGTKLHIDSIDRPGRTIYATVVPK